MPEIGEIGHFGTQIPHFETFLYLYLTAGTKKWVKVVVLDFQQNLLLQPKSWRILLLLLLLKTFGLCTILLPL